MASQVLQAVTGQAHPGQAGSSVFQACGEVIGHSAVIGGLAAPEGLGSLAELQHQGLQVEPFGGVLGAAQRLLQQVQLVRHLSPQLALSGAGLACCPCARCG